MNFQVMTEAVSRNLRENGLWATLRKTTQILLMGQEPPDDFDLKNGTDTSGVVPLWKLSIASQNAQLGRRYRATEEWELEAAVRVLDGDVRSFTFVDLGCGKGRALLIAARLGFRRVIGVEFAAELAAAARNNIQKMALTNASIVEGDATEFSLPSGDLVVFLFNPFGKELVAKVAVNLVQPRQGKLYVIYVNPHCADIFDASLVLKRVGTSEAREFPTVVWKLVPNGCETRARVGPRQFTPDPS